MLKKNFKNGFLHIKPERSILFTYIYEFFYICNSKIQIFVKYIELKTLLNFGKNIFWAKIVLQLFLAKNFSSGFLVSKNINIDSFYIYIYINEKIYLCNEYQWRYQYQNHSKLKLLATLRTQFEPNLFGQVHLLGILGRQSETIFVFFQKTEALRVLISTKATCSTNKTYIKQIFITFIHLAAVCARSKLSF